jgi:hypothetical protein
MAGFEKNAGRPALAKCDLTRQSGFMAKSWHHHGSLCPHPVGGAGIARAINVDLRLSGNILTLDYAIMAPDGQVRLPAPAHPERTDGLWQMTCCELFLKGQGAAYFEFNLSPSGQWAAYHFAGYRQGMAEAAIATPPSISVHHGQGPVMLGARIDLACLPAAFVSADWRLGLSCVIEGADGAKAYWALNHPPEKPDFHHDDCFALSLRAAERL